MGDYLRNKRKRSRRGSLELNDSCLDLGSTHVDVSCDFEVAVAQIDNDLNLVELQDVGELEEAELQNFHRDEGFITMLATSHGYTLRGHQDEDLSLIKKRKVYKRIWQQNYKL